MAQQTPVGELTPAQLIEEFRTINRRLGGMPVGTYDEFLQKRSDLIEEELLRRIAW